MSRERVEDLGKISILIDEVLENKFFEEEFFVSLDNDATDKNQLLNIFIEELAVIRFKLYQIKNIANGGTYDQYGYD